MADPHLRLCLQIAWVSFGRAEVVNFSRAPKRNRVRDPNSPSASAKPNRPRLRLPPLRWLPRLIEALQAPENIASEFFHPTTTSVPVDLVFVVLVEDAPDKHP